MAKYHKLLHCVKYVLKTNTPRKNKNGNLGGKSFAVWSSSKQNDSYDAYKSFTSDDATYCAISQNGYGKSKDKPYYYIMYFPYKGGKFSRFTHKNRNRYVASPRDIELQASNDCSNWITLCTMVNTNNIASDTWDLVIPTEKQDFYKYYRYIITSSNSENFCALGFITFHGEWYGMTQENIPIYTTSYDDDINGCALPIIMDKQEMYVGYGDSTYNGALKLSNINCKYKDITPEGAKLLKV